MNVKETSIVTLRINLTDCISKFRSAHIEPRQIGAVSWEDVPETTAPSRLISYITLLIIF